MKLHSTLRFNPGLLLVAPVMDVMCSLMLFFLLGSDLVVPSGASIELPRSQFVLRDFNVGHTLVVPAGDQPTILLDRRPVAYAELGAMLDALAAEDRKENGKVGALIIRADRYVPHGRVMDIQNQVLARGFAVAIAATPADS
ncbi:ExbD/TolR family protein [Sulfuriroseicoccus oceanibius]|uniref:Biopolymer transporter ExbD n=1 Tax=Sulfuriroseicoccus oceanibius TaxID=2707525 RepID=A0A6B3L6G4_9BACT|nr:biopolymer transporter ExbD [Sulfuriroseicoccus oceanibius]QQL46304.1 biopolymer transporter ExbD [Sulfuriroseicoccus oceanibius]